MNRKVFPAFLIFQTLILGAETIHFNKPEEFGASQRFYRDGVLVCRNQWRVVLARKHKIDPAAQYKLSLTFKTREAPSRPLRLLAGFAVYDADKREIQPYEIHHVKNSGTELAAPANAGDTIIKVKDASRWRKNTFISIAFHARDDFKDLPNRDVMNGNVREIAARNGMYEILLKKPLSKSYPAGTKIRQHLYSSNLFVINSPVTETESKKSGSLSGISDGKSGVFNGKWWPGAVYFSPVISVWPKTDDVVELKNISLEIKRADDIF